MDEFIRVLSILEREARTPKVFSITLFNLGCLRLQTSCSSGKFPRYVVISHVFKEKFCLQGRNISVKWFNYKDEKIKK